MRKLSCFVFCTFIILFQTGVSRGVERDLVRGPVTIEADSLRYDSGGDTYEATGNVLITFEGGFLRADHVFMNNSTKDADASGDVYIQSDQDILQGEKVRFNVETKRGTVFGGLLFVKENNLYIQAEEISKTGEATYTLKDARATTCDGSTPDWRFAGREVDVTVDGYGRLTQGSFQIRNIPVLYLPYLIFPAKTTRQTGVLFPRIAYSQDKFGWDVGLPFYWKISDYTDATFYQRYMDKRGFQEGAEFRYCLAEDSYGTLYGDYLNDTFETTETDGSGLEREWDDHRKRWSYYLNTETVISEGFYLRTDIKKVSDIWYFRDFESYNYYQEHYNRAGDRRHDTGAFTADRALASLDSTVRLVKD